MAARCLLVGFVPPLRGVEAVDDTHGGAEQVRDAVVVKLTMAYT